MLEALYLTGGLDSELGDVYTVPDSEMERCRRCIGRALFTLRMLLSKQFLLQNSTAPLRC